MVPFIPPFMNVQVVTFCMAILGRFEDVVILNEMRISITKCTKTWQFVAQREMTEESVEEGKEARLSLLVTDLQVFHKHIRDLHDFDSKAGFHHSPRLSWESDGHL